MFLYLCLAVKVPVPLYGNEEVKSTYRGTGKRGSHEELGVTRAIKPRVLNMQCYWQAQRECTQSLCERRDGRVGK